MLCNERLIGSKVAESYVGGPRAFLVEEFVIALDSLMRTKADVPFMREGNWRVSISWEPEQKERKE